MKNPILFILLLSLFFTSCYPKLYEPAPINIVGIKKKNDVKLNMRVSNNMNIGAAYSPVNNLIVLISHNDRSQAPSTGLLGSKTGSSIHNTNVGVGFYKALNKHFFIEGQSSIGWGKFMLDREEFSLETALKVMENNLVIYGTSNHIEMGGALQFKRHLFKKDIMGDIAIGEITWSQKIRDNLNTNFLELAIFTKLKVRKVEFEFQVGRSMNLTDENIGIEDSGFASIGFAVEF